MRHLILSKEDLPTDHKHREAAERYPFVADIVGNTICADLLDYLDRDHQSLGLPAKLGHRFVDAFYVTPSTAPYYRQRMAIKVFRNGGLRSDVVTELFKFLRYRYELSERALVHHAKLAADAMVGKTLEMWFDALRTEKALTLNPELRQYESTDIDDLLARAESVSPELRQQIQERAVLDLEERFLRHGDDGLIEWLLGWAEHDETVDRRKAAVAELSRSLLDRRLYKLAGRSNTSARSLAKDIHDRYGGFDQRRRLEEEVARYAGLEHRWYVVLWIPPPEMRLKAADVLIDTGNQVMPLKDYDHATMQRGKEIYESHEALWAVSVYVHPSIASNQRQKDIILTWLRDRLGLEWVELRQGRSLEQLAAEQVGEELKLSRAEEERIAVGAAAYKGDISNENFDSLLRRIGLIAKAQSIPGNVNFEQERPREILSAGTRSAPGNSEFGKDEQGETRKLL